MIEISSSGKCIIVKIDYKYPASDFKMVLTSEQPDEVTAKLKADNLKDNLGDTIQRIRETEYRSGWDDAKKRRRKEEYFWRTWK